MKKDDKKDKLIDSINEIIGFHGEPKDIAEQIDNIIFDYINSLYSNNSNIGGYYGANVFLLKTIRNLFWSLENEEKFKV